MSRGSGLVTAGLWALVGFAIIACGGIVGAVGMLLRVEDSPAATARATPTTPVTPVQVLPAASPPAPPEPATQPKPAPIGPRFRSGDRVAVARNDQNEPWAVRSPFVLPRFLELVKAQDRLGVSQLEHAGDLFWLAPGAPAVVIKGVGEGDDEMYEVRLTGANAVRYEPVRNYGVAVYVLPEFLSR